MKTLNLGLIGFGTVGSATYSVLQKNNIEISRRLGCNIKIKIICVRDLSRVSDRSFPNTRLVTDIKDIIQSKDIDIVIELIGGVGVAKQLVEDAIKNKKHVITANKELIALHGNDLFKMAKQNNVALGFEAAVAGGIPLIKGLTEGLAANKIEWVAGIINGTTNYILTEMQKSHSSFEDSLRDAIDKGYAEQDPTFDIDGTDAAHKLCIIAAVGFGVGVQFDRVFKEGITNIELKDVFYAEKFGYKIKLIGIIKKRKEGLEVRVHPAMIPKGSVMAGIDGAMNAVLIQGNAVGPTLQYGAGAGGEATASAVLGDVIDVTKKIISGSKVFYLGIGKGHNYEDSEKVLLPDDTQSSYYLRVMVNDKVGVMSQLTNILANNTISIEAIFQGQSLPDDKKAEIVIITHKAKEGLIKSAIWQINKLEVVYGEIKLLRIEKLDVG